MRPIDLAIDTAHWMALAPLLYLIAFRRDAHPIYWMAAWGFAASWFVDTVAEVTDGSWIATQYLPAFQLGAFGSAMGAALWFPLGLILLSFVADPVLVTLLGSCVVIWYAANHPFRDSMLAYCGFGSVMLLGFVATASIPTWLGYQVARAFGIGFFIKAAR